MKSISNQHFIGFNLILIVLLCNTCGIWQDNELAMLQRAYVFSDSENKREKIVDQLEDYFLKMPIPDSLEQKLYSDVDTLIKEYNTETHTSLENYRDEPNIYQVESKFYGLIKSKIISLAKREKTEFHNMDSIAAYIDSQLGINYWKAFFNEIKNYTPEQAKCWLIAQRASQDCKRSFDSFKKWENGLKYAAIGLKYLNRIDDKRIKFDIIQRIQYALYNYYGYHELSIAFANRYMEQCQSIGYHLRTNSMLYHIASAYFQASHFSLALEYFQNVISVSNQYQDAPFMDWYLKNGLLSLADTYFWLGQYRKAFFACDSAERTDLNIRQKLNLLITKGMIHRNQGNYDQAEMYYHDALALAASTNDFENKINMFNNFGSMFFELSEYRQSLEYNNLALSELKMYLPDNLPIKIKLLIEIASAYAKLGEFDRIEAILQDAQQSLDRIGENPLQDADLLNIIGRFQLDIEQYEDAMEALKKAESICDDNGLIKLGLKVKLNLAYCNIAFKNFKDAKIKISEGLSVAKKIEDFEKQIDAYAAMARLESIQGNHDQANKAGLELIQSINILSHKFENSQRLIAYQQKMNGYLKATVVNELKLKRLDSAITKLDFAKSLVFLNQKNLKDGLLEYSGNVDINGFVGKLNPDIQIINYMLGKDTLYTFLINKSGISVRSKSISYDSLKSLVMNYVYTINNTIKIFKKYDQNKVDRHYQLTTSLANQLSNILINDEILNKLNSNSTMYIIPDDFLHFIPFATLVIEKESEIKFLIEKTNIAYLPGIFSSFGKSKRNDKSSKNKVLLATDPAMPNMGKLTGFVNRQYPETHILKTDGEVMYKQEILAGIENKYDIYIFAGHSYSSSWNIADSYIEVTVRSSGDIKNQIFQLTMPDINGMNWNSSDLIFLLGCETAGGNLYRGMGISGLQSSFLLSGADNILASLWRIDAVQSIKQATDFLSEYKKTNDIAGSIRHSQLTAINRLKLNNYFKNPHPYFWGSYLLAQNKISFINRR